MLPGLLFSMRSLGLYGVSGGPWVRGAGRRAVASGSRARGRGGTEAYDEDRDTEERDPPEKLKALLQEELRRQKVIRFHRARRQMTPPGPPSRRLTWDAIQQIRYLKQEFPEEWTVERLAEGFSVSRDVIGRVLRSKFVPPAERRERQDARATSTAGQRAPPPGAGVRGGSCWTAGWSQSDAGPRQWGCSSDPGWGTRQGGCGISLSRGVQLSQGCCCTLRAATSSPQPALLPRAGEHSHGHQGGRV
uniref:Neugrin n=1 Tax=Scleropages formosus TaxID=113540 RepID=A0A8C9VJ20_SCLFO